MCISFHLFDPAKFRINETENIRIFNKCFTDEEALAYRTEYDCSLTSGGLVFISDIRTQINEESVWKDMLMQKQWHEILVPDMTSLKFRLPWDLPPEQSVSYLQGDVYFPVCGSTSATECRLFIDRRKHENEKKYFPLDENTRMKRSTFH